MDSKKHLRDLESVEKTFATPGDSLLESEKGYGDLTPIEEERDSRLMGQAYEAKLINDGLADLKAGKTVNGKSVLDEMRQKYAL